MSAASIPGGDHVLVASDSTVLGASERLNQSRRLLREHMQALNASASDALANEHRRPGAWLAALTAIPVLGPVIESVSAWWAQHPLRVVADVFASSTASAAKPMTQSRPWTVLLMAVAIGGLLVWLRPWRYALLRRAVYGGVLPPLVSSFMSRLPTQDWLDNIVNSLTRSLVTATPPKASTTPASTNPGPASERAADSTPASGHGATPINPSLH